ncbi:helix-turn-helix domain-containing protein [Candidatus Babeliales bacterium]|nr:helix-turn-helix domain-containing protein [Candidatus Babeliales bacterium]
MKELTKNQMLRITRIGKGLTLEKVAKKVFLSTSFISLMETGDRKIPDFVEDILDFEEGVRWYETIVTALSKSDYTSVDEADEALQTLNRVLRI